MLIFFLNTYQGNNIFGDSIIDGQFSDRLSDRINLAQHYLKHGPFYYFITEKLVALVQCKKNVILFKKKKNTTKWDKSV